MGNCALIFLNFRKMTFDSSTPSHGIQTLLVPVYAHILTYIDSVANPLKSPHSPAGDLPQKSGSPDQMLIALIDNELSF